MQTIMVQMSDERWTMEAMHLACALARSINARVVLLRMVLANNPGLLGWRIVPPSAEEQRRISEYTGVADDYGVEFCVQPMQFVSLFEALAQAAETLNSSVLFAHIPQSSIPFWQQFRLWNLKRQLGDCHLYTLDGAQPLGAAEAAIPPTVVWENRRSWVGRGTNTQPASRS